MEILRLKSSRDYGLVHGVGLRCRCYDSSPSKPVTCGFLEIVDALEGFTCNLELVHDVRLSC